MNPKSNDDQDGHPSMHWPPTVEGEPQPGSPMAGNHRENNQQQKKEADKFRPVAQFERNEKPVFGNEYQDGVYDYQTGNDETGNPMKSEKIAKTEDPVQAFQPSAQDGLQQQQTPGNQSHHLTRAQKLPVRSEFIENCGRFKIKWNGYRASNG